MAVKAALRLTRSAMSDTVRADMAKFNPSQDAYRLDPLSHLDAGHVTILDVESKRPVPFRLYDHEAELIDAWVTVHEGEAGEQPWLEWHNVRGEKSRQMGWTWTVAYVILWSLMYWPVRGLAQHVDLGRIADIPTEGRSPTDSLFGKVRYMAEGEGWPEWAAPAEFLSFRHGPEQMIVSNLTGGYIIGRGQEDDPATGGTYDYYLQDESARIEHGNLVEESVVSACPTGRMYISTPHGKDNVFYQLKDPPREGFRYLRHHWSIHPVYSRGLHIAGTEPASCVRCAAMLAGEKWVANNPLSAHRYPGKLTSPWYDGMVAQIVDDERIAQELDISYERSIGARVYPEFSAEKHVRPHIPYVDGVDVQLSWDYGWSPSFTSVGIWQDLPGELRKIGELEVQEQTPEQVAALVRERVVSLMLRAGMDLEYARNFVQPNFTRGWLAVGDPSGAATEIGSGESIVIQYRKQGFEISSPTKKGKRGSPGFVRQTITSYKRLLHGVPKPVFYSADTCADTIRHLESNRYKTDRTGAVLQSYEILNDSHNHMTRADAYYVSYKYPAPQVEEQTEQSGFVRDTAQPHYFRLSPEDAQQLAGQGNGTQRDNGLKPGMRL